MSVQNNLLNKYIINQFNYSDYKTMVEIFINLIETLQMKLQENALGIKMTSNYNLAIPGHSSRNINSKIETFLIKNYNTEYKIKSCITKFVDAYNKLNYSEKIIFYYTFFKNYKDENILDELKLTSFDLNKIRKSAVIKFSLILGFDKLVDQVLCK